ncbi:hypothetical protein [Streptomyces sp. NRRL F-4489]|uniref:hypothetical protein n=1 Tax=Streptomyces sp. NRRL F-4489 TaxID=1609095 RepID=UPI000B2F895F|nr:hypothetical protein [Streptomyces sp. NRRL F-4489]
MVCVRPNSPRAAIRAGIALVTEDRKGQGLVLGQPGLDNALLVVNPGPVYFAPSIV